MKIILIVLAFMISSTLIGCGDSKNLSYLNPQQKQISEKIFQMEEKAISINKKTGSVTRESENERNKMLDDVKQLQNELADLEVNDWVCTVSESSPKDLVRGLRNISTMNFKSVDVTCLGNKDGRKDSYSYHHDSNNQTYTLEIPEEIATGLKKVYQGDRLKFSGKVTGVLIGSFNHNHSIGFLTNKVDFIKK